MECLQMAKSVVSDQRLEERSHDNNVFASNQESSHWFVFRHNISESIDGSKQIQPEIESQVILDLRPKVLTITSIDGPLGL